METNGATYLRLPWPPSVNHYWRRMQIRGKHIVSISKKGREFRKAVVGDVLRQLGTRPEPYAGRMGVRLELYPPDRRKRDIDNHHKALFDALTHTGIWEDDGQVDEIHTYRMNVTPPGCAIVEIWPREAEPCRP